MTIAAADRPRVAGFMGMRAVAIAVWMCTAACNRVEQATTQSPKAASVPLGNAVLLGSVAVPPYDYRFVLPDACPDTCETQVQLITQGRVVDTYALPYPAFGRKYYPDVYTSETDWRWGADRGLTAWSTGGENSDVATTARAVQLAPGMTGLLVSQRGGWEHIGRTHVLLLPQQGKLVSLWSAEDSGDFTVDFTEVAPAGQLGLVSIEIEHGIYLDGDPADNLSVRHVFWNAAAGKMEERTLPQPGFPLYLLSVGSYASVAEARAAEDRCYDFGRLAVLDARRFAPLVAGAAFNGWLLARRDEAEAALREVRECASNLDVALHEYRAKGAVTPR